jgi:hypothetical protein
VNVPSVPTFFGVDIIEGSPVGIEPASLRMASQGNELTKRGALGAGPVFQIEFPI